MAGFIEIEHIADRAVQVWASTPAQLLQEAARAMFSLMADLSAIAPLQRHEVTLDAEELESALINWLNELLFWRETRQEMYSQFSVSLEGRQVKGWFAGQPALPTAAVVKAATFHDLRVRQDEAGLWRATIVFDT